MKKIDFIIQTLERLFPHPKPFLEYKNHFTLLVAVLLSGHSTDRRVNLVTPTLFGLADTPEKMAQLSIKEIEEIIRPCGLAPTKAKAIHSLSEKIVKEFGGKVPATFAELESLPHVGHKTAAVVLVQGFGIPAFPVDTHIVRLSQRWALSLKKNPTQVGKELMSLFPKEKWHDIHLQMIAYGRTYCPARGHKLENCPICSFCKEHP